MLPAPIVQFPLQIWFQFAALLKCGIQYIERDFACIWFRFFSWWLKAWPACCPLPVLSRFPGGPPPPPSLFPGWSSIRVKWVESRQGYRFHPSPTLVRSAGSSGAPPHLTCLRCSKTNSGAAADPEIPACLTSICLLNRFVGHVILVLQKQKCKMVAYKKLSHFEILPILYLKKKVGKLWLNHNVKNRIN